MKYLGGNILTDLEKNLNNKINNIDSTISNFTKSIDNTQQPIQQQSSMQQQSPMQQQPSTQQQPPMQQQPQPKKASNTKLQLPSIITDTVNIVNKQVPTEKEINKKMSTMLTYKPLQVKTLSPLDLDYIKTKQPFIDNNNSLFKASSQKGLQTQSKNISTQKPLLIEKKTQKPISFTQTNSPNEVFPLRTEQHHVANVDDDTTMQPIEIARNLSKEMYPKIQQPEYIGHQTSLLANNAFVLGSKEISIFPDIKEIPLNIELNVEPHDNSEIGSISKKLDGTTVSPQELPEPVFYSNDTKLQGIKNPYRYYSQFQKIMTKESESTIDNLKNKISNQTTKNDNLRDVIGNDANLNYMNFKDFMTSKDKIINSQ